MSLRPAVELSGPLQQGNMVVVVSVKCTNVLQFKIWVAQRTLTFPFN